MSHLERKASWHLVGVGTQPTACRTGPVNRDPSTQSQSAENPRHRAWGHERGPRMGGRQAESHGGNVGSAPLHQGQPRSHHSPVQTQVEGAEVHTSHCQPWGASGVNSQTPRPLLVRGPPLTRSPSADCRVRYAWKWAGEVGENVHFLTPLPRAHLLAPCSVHPPRPPAAPQQAGGAAGGREGTQRVAVLGAGQRRAVPRALLHRPDSRAAQRPVGAALSLREPQRLHLPRGPVRPRGLAASLSTLPRPAGAAPPSEGLLGARSPAPHGFHSPHPPDPSPSTHIPSSCV